MDKRVILGIDPGLATVGYALLCVSPQETEVLEFGVIETPAGLGFAERLFMIQKDLQNIVDRFSPTESYVEELFFSTNSKTALSVAHARGVIMAELESSGLKPRSITPNQVKTGVTGDGRADKIQVQEMMMRQFQLSDYPQPDDAADALAIAFCGSLFVD